LRPSPFREGAAEAVEALPRRRKGKVAQLSKEVRDRLNQMLLDGVPYEDIISKLGKKGASLNKVNLHSWFVGGHQDWLKEQRLLEECRLRQELTLDFAREEQGIGAFQAAHKISVGLICQAVAEFGPDTLREAF